MQNIKNIYLTIEESIYDTTKFFYQSKIEEGNKHLNQTIQTILEGMDGIYQLYQEFNLRADDSTLNNVLIKAMTALEAKDFVLLSDILRYEVLEIMKEYSKNFTERQGEQYDNI